MGVGGAQPPCEFMFPQVSCCQAKLVIIVTHRFGPFWSPFCSNEGHGVPPHTILSTEYWVFWLLSVLPYSAGILFSNPSLWDSQVMGKRRWETKILPSVLTLCHVYDPKHGVCHQSINLMAFLVPLQCSCFGVSLWKIAGLPTVWFKSSEVWMPSVNAPSLSTDSS